MLHPLVSVIVTTYNRTDYLKLTLESVFNQTFTDFEIIVIDNGTANNLNEQLCNQFEKVKYFKIENSGGPARPRNVGIREAQGKFIAFLDDDDLWLPDRLERQVAILERKSDYGLVHSCCEVIDENGKLKNQVIGRPGTPDVKHGDVSLRMMGNWTIMMPTPLMRKEVIDRVGFFNEEMPSAGEDVEFWVRCSFEAKFYYIDESLAQYRVHSGNISGSSAKYIELPLYLKKVLSEVYDKEKISKEDYQLLLYRLCQMQLKMIKLNFFKTIRYVFVLHTFWFLKINNNKLLIKMLFFK
ncbi:MAG: glycosyltransferase [Paludibacter sp.]|nr:glycosyltransferase [Paludibacter sp.]